MTDIANIKIPQELLPEDGRFGAGPSKIRPAQITALANAGKTLLGTSHRQKPVKAEVARIKAGLADLFNLPDGYEVVLGNGGSTAFWDIATFSLLRDKAQFLVFGEFGSKFAASAKAAPFLSDPIVIKEDPGNAPAFEPAAGIDAYCTAHNETSTGVAVKPYRPAGIDADALVIIDATSGAGGLDVDLSDVDVYYFSPQKCFGSDGGLFIAIMSPKAIARAEEIKASGRYIPPFLDLMTAIENSRLDQTNNTPAVATLLMMAEQIDWFNANGGLRWTTARTAESAGLLYSWADNNPNTTAFVPDSTKRSNVVVTINFDDAIDASQISTVLRKHGVVDIEPYRKLGKNQLRVSVFPAVEPSDVAKLISCFDYVVAELTI